MQNIGENIVKKHIRYDLEIISQLIMPKSKVLDIGCGDGQLLEFLKSEKNVEGQGLEISQPLVTKTIQRGISAIQGDGETDLEFYPNHHFDYAILGQTIQATKNPKKMLLEMLRIARYAIVSIPNFTHYKNRLQIMFKGVMPVNENLPFTWYDTPNIHFCSIKDFENLCAELNFKIEQKIFLTSKHKLNSLLNFNILPNFFAEYGIFLITRDEIAASTQTEFVFSDKLKQKISLGLAAPVAQSNNYNDN